MTEARQARLRLRVREIRDETPDARTLVLEPVSRTIDTAYAAGQFLTLHLPVDHDRTVARSYSMSSCPVSDPYPAITVKREPDGAGSNWLFGNVNPGAILDASPAGGSFRLDASDKPLHLFAAGVGITPVFSICKYALHATRRPVFLHYSSRSARTALFRSEITRLEAAFDDRLTVDRHYTADSGRIDAARVQVLLKRVTDPVLFVCGPAPFIEMVREASRAARIPDADFITEAFTPPAPKRTGPSTEPAAGAHVSVGGREYRVPWPRDRPLIEALDDGGVEAPSSCRQGECLTCECRITSGTARMRYNAVLDEDDIADGYALACQLLPTSDTVHIEFD